MAVSSSTLKVGVAAILVGLVGAYLLRMYLTKEEAVAATPPARVSVPLASIDLPAGRVLKLGDMGLMPMTQEQMQSRGYDLTRLMLAPEQIIGRTLSEPIKLGNPFLTTNLYPEGSGPNPLDRLKPGFRAVDLQVPLDAGGDVPVGTYVDVLFRSNPQPATDDEPAIPELTVTLASGLEVIGVRIPEVTHLQAAMGYVSKFPTVTLAVSPQEARVFQTVQGRGEISLSARSPGEANLPSLGSDEQLTFRQLLGIEPKDPLPPPQDFTTVIYRRGSPSASTFRYVDPNAVRASQSPRLMVSPSPTPRASDLTPANAPVDAAGATDPLIDPNDRSSFDPSDVANP